MTIATTLVDTHALLQLVYISLAAGVGICAVYALAVIGFTRSHEHRKANRPRAAALYGALAVIAIAGCGWAVITGLTIMATK
jgi:hypothetical protein